jgi:HEAT repeat protein
MQNAILRTLGKLGDPAGVEAALGVLRDAKAPEGEREAACDAMLAARETRALPTLLAIAKDAKAPANLRVSAAMTLGRLGGKAEYEAFAPIAKSEGYAEFKEVLERLELAKDCGADTDDCYTRGLEAKKLTQQEKAAFMLGMAKDRKKAVQSLVAHLSTQEPVVRLAMINSLGRIADGSCADCRTKLKELIDKEEKVALKIRAFQPLVDEMKVTLAALSRS